MKYSEKLKLPLDYGYSEYGYHDYVAVHHNNITKIYRILEIKSFPRSNMVEYVVKNRKTGRLLYCDEEDIVANVNGAQMSVYIGELIES